MNEPESLPSHGDIDVNHRLDEISACKHFLNKSLDEAEALFRKNSLHYQEDLMWMGAVGFRFYINAAIRYVHSEGAECDSDIVSCLATIFEFRLKHDSSGLQHIAEPLVRFCYYVVEHFDRFDASPEFFGALRSRYRALVATFRDLARDHK